MRLGGTKLLGATGAAALAAAVLVLGPVPFGTGGSVEPKRGTYAGGGNLKDDASSWVQVGFIFNQGQVTQEAGVAGYPGGCTGGWSIPPASIDADGRFDVSQGNQRFRGRFVEDNVAKGTIKLEHTAFPQCTGIYKYNFKARRYGGP